MTGAATLARLRIPRRWYLPLGVFCWAQLVLFVWWLAQYPGLLSFDSVSYVIHVTSGPWTADHSVLYDSLVLGSLTLTSNVAMLTFVQTTCAAAVLAYAATSLRTYGVRGRWAALPGMLMPLIPSFGTFVVTVWKDVPFALCQMLATATIVRIMARRRTRDATPTSMRPLLIGLGAEFVGLVLFRNDGFLVVALLTLILAIFMTGLRTRVLAVGLAALVVLAFSELVLYPAGGIQKPPSSLAYGTFYGDVALVYSEAPGTFTTADKRLMAKVAPLSEWRSANDCYWSDPLFLPPFDLAEASKLKNDLAALWFRVLARTPVALIKGRLCRGSVAWDLFSPPRSKIGYSEMPVHGSVTLWGRIAEYPGEPDSVPQDIAHNLVGSHPSDRLARAAFNVRNAMGQTKYQLLFYRAAEWAYLAYLALAAVAWRRRRWSVLLAGAVCLASQVAVTAVNPAPLFRYIAGILFAAMLLLPMLTLARGPRDPAPESRDAAASDDHAALGTNAEGQVHDRGEGEGHGRGPGRATQRVEGLVVDHPDHGEHGQDDEAAPSGAVPGGEADQNQPGHRPGQVLLQHELAAQHESDQRERRVPPHVRKLAQPDRAGREDEK